MFKRKIDSFAKQLYEYDLQTNQKEQMSELTQNAQNKIREYQIAIDAIQALDGIVASVTGAENFAVVRKGNTTHFVILDEQQASVVNGKSIPLETVAELPTKIRKLVADAIDTSLLKHKAVIKPIGGVNITAENALTK